jgi:hypothetical protein
MNVGKRRTVRVLEYVLRSVLLGATLFVLVDLFSLCLCTVVGDFYNLSRVCSSNAS